MPHIRKSCASFATELHLWVSSAPQAAECDKNDPVSFASLSLYLKW